MGYLSSMITEETGYGTSGCPWKIKVSPGQQVALTAFDFNLLSGTTRDDHYIKDEFNSWCPISIVIEDHDTKKDIPLCIGGQRENHLYTSIGNVLAIHFVIRKMTDVHYYFLVRYQGERIMLLRVIQLQGQHNILIRKNNEFTVYHVCCINFWKRNK